MESHLVIGEVAKPQGVKGQMKVRAFTNDAERFRSLKQVYLEANGAFEARAVHCARVAEGFAYLEMAGVDTPEAVDALRGRLLYVDRAHALKLGEAENFIVDLIGCTVRDERGEVYGTVREVLQPAANDVYVVEGPRGEVLIPALKSVVTSVDVAAKVIAVDRARVLETASFPDEA